MSRYMDTSGGEAWVGDEKINDYSLHVDNTTISDIQGEDLARFVEKAVNHLRLNGHVFEWHQVDCQDQPRVLKYGGTL